MEAESLADSSSHLSNDTTPDMFADLDAILTLIPQAELASSQGDYATAIKNLQTAIEHEDNLPYNEPPNWHHPTRQVLGNILMKSGNFSEAEKIFREDLKKFRDNGWSLYGLYQVLEKSGKNDEAKKVYQAYREAWSYADFELKSASF